MEGSKPGLLRPLPRKMRRKGGKNKIDASDVSCNGNDEEGSTEPHRDTTYSSDLQDPSNSESHAGPCVDKPEPGKSVENSNSESQARPCVGQPESGKSVETSKDEISLEEIESFCRRTGGEKGTYDDNDQFAPDSAPTQDNSPEGGSQGFREERVLLRLRGHLASVGSGSARGATVTQVCVTLKFDRQLSAGTVKLSATLSDNGLGKGEERGWKIESKPDVNQFSVTAKPSPGTDAQSSAGPDEQQHRSDPSPRQQQQQQQEQQEQQQQQQEREKQRQQQQDKQQKQSTKARRSLTVMAQRWSWPSVTVPAAPAVTDSGQRSVLSQESTGASTKREEPELLFELPLEFQLSMQTAAVGAEPRSGWRYSLGAPEEHDKEGKGARTLLELVDGEVVIKYVEENETVPVTVTRRFHDMVWLDSTASRRPHPQATGPEDLGGASFFSQPESGWIWPPSTVLDSGTMNWQAKEEKRFSFVRVGESKMEDGRVNPHLLRFYMESVWQLKRPKLFVSVTGAAKYFDLADAPKEKLRRGLQELGRVEGVWMATGGCSAGIMQFVGQARALMEVPVPLIGFATWGCIRGREKMLRPPRSSAAPDNAEEGYKDVVAESDKHPDKNVELDENHSHFVLVSDGTADEFGKEFDVRAQMESVLTGTQSKSKDILQKLKQLQMGWKDMVVKQAQEQLDSRQNPIPLVLICVQGGPDRKSVV